MKTIKLSFLILAVVVSNTPASVFAQQSLKAANIFTDNMVLQRDEAFVIWGWAGVNEEVSVSLKGQSVTAKADAKGKWIAKFEPIGLGDPFTVTLKDATNEITFSNVVAGDVWICSGQSNMEWEVKNCGNPKEEIANGNYPMIRHVRVDHVTSTTKLDDVTNSGWQICTPETVGNFSATGYYFGRELHKQLDVPIGLLHTSWGGTIIETWISGENLRRHPDFREAVAKVVASGGDKAKQQELAAKAQAWAESFRKALEDESDEWQAVDLDDSTWKRIKVPGHWEWQGFDGMDGVGWYRHRFNLPADAVGKKSTLSIAMIDDVDHTYVNGKLVGGMTTWNERREYEIPIDLLKAGENTIAIRVADGNGGGGIHGKDENVFLQVDGQDRIKLAGRWRFKPSTPTAALGKRPGQAFAGPNHPTLLHNAMINPILPYSAKGVIWYQGESNTGRAYQYRSLMPLLIEDWRDKWNKELPFYWVQLANYTAAAEQPGDSTWAELREAQSMALATPKTGQAVIIDIGEAKDIHPKNKQDVGKRLALNALAKDYGKEVEFSGPVFKSVSIEGNIAKLEFDHAEGLTAKGGELKRFEIAGVDKKFVWADAKIEGNQVIISSTSVKFPVAVRYAWSDNPEGCNLYNGAGLPASPFRTDAWKGVTQF
jgi:sialate O-acetylesterase